MLEENFEDRFVFWKGCPPQSLVLKIGAHRVSYGRGPGEFPLKIGVDCQDLAENAAGAASKTINLVWAHGSPVVSRRDASTAADATSGQVVS